MRACVVENMACSGWLFLDFKACFVINPIIIIIMLFGYLVIFGLLIFSFAFNKRSYYVL